MCKHSRSYFSYYGRKTSLPTVPVNQTQNRPDVTRFWNPRLPPPTCVPSVYTPCVHCPVSDPRRNTSAPAPSPDSVLVITISTYSRATVTSGKALEARGADHRWHSSSDPEPLTSLTPRSPGLRGWISHPCPLPYQVGEIHSLWKLLS